MRLPNCLSWRLFLLLALVAGGASAAPGDEPIHRLIDAKLQAVGGAEAPQTSDAEFLRRVSLDLIGMPPTADEARQFLADSAADKRQRLIDRLFASPHFSRRLATSLDVMLMERRPHANVGADEWQAWLLKAVKENKPWNVLVREILLADGEDPAQRPAARFVLDRESDPHVLTRDIGRIFFGRDMQCAQCHDHPLVDDYLQSDYHGLLAFVAPSYPLVRTVDGKQITVQAERAGADLAFESVFVGKPRRTGARMPGDVVIDEPFFLPGEEYDVAPADNVKSEPKFSRRAKLAEMATSGANQDFNCNIANRLWAHMFGRGLVHPLDLRHPANPAIDPELLQVLGERFAAMSFDMRRFLREIALSNAYQRSLDPPIETSTLAARAGDEARQLKQRRDDLKVEAESATASYATAAEAWETAEAALLPAAGEFDAVRNEYAVAKTNLDAAVKAKNDAAAQLSTKQAVAPPLQQAALAAQEASKALPEDKELADAAQKFVARSEQLVAEMTALQRTVDEKSSALPTLTEAFSTTRPKIDDARAKVTPLSNDWRQREQAMLTSRRAADSKAEALAAVNRRLTTARRLAKLPKLKQAVVAAQLLAASREKELAEARRRLDDHLALVATKEAEVTAAAESFSAVASQAEASPLVRVSLIADATSPQRVGVAAARRAAQALAAAQQALETVKADGQALTAAVDHATQSLTYALAESQATQAAFDAAESDLIERWTQDFTLASLKALTPEQLCWSVFRVTGVYDRYWHVEATELEKASPLAIPQLREPTARLAREFDLEQRTFDKLKPNIAAFVAFYGAAPGQPQGDFFSTADQALFAANGDAINAWVAPAGDNVTDRVAKQKDPRAAAQELYLAVLTRPPSEDEASEVATYLAHRTSDKAAAAQELVWALLNSAEFRFNH